VPHYHNSLGQSSYVHPSSRNSPVVSVIIFLVMMVILNNIPEMCNRNESCQISTGCGTVSRFYLVQCCTCAAMLRLSPVKLYDMVVSGGNRTHLMYL